MTPLRSLAAVAVVAALSIAGCAPPVTQREPGAAVAPATAASLRGPYEEAAARGDVVHRVDSAQSVVAITVRRGGSLARLGHDHVVASHAVQGWIAPETGRADLFVPLAELAVDEPALRAEAGLDTQPTAADIAGTRANMQDKVLEVQKYPHALIRIARVGDAAPGTPLDVAITLHGVTRSISVPARIVAGRDALEVTGSFEFNQSDFGIVPFSVLGGAVQVQDRLGLRFRIVSRRTERPGDPAD